MGICDVTMLAVSESHGTTHKMLVLSRKRDEQIVISENIVVTVVDIRGDKVRLGIDAPVDIPVHRQEVFDALQRKETQQADKSSTDENITK